MVRIASSQVLRAPLPADQADDDAAHGQDDDDARPGPGIGQHGERGGCHREPAPAWSARTRRGRNSRRSAVPPAAARQQHDQRIAIRRAAILPPGFGKAVSSASRTTIGSNSSRRIRRGVGQRQHDSPPRPSGRSRPPLSPGRITHQRRERDQGTPTWRRRWRTRPGAASGRGRRTARRRRRRPGARRAGWRCPTAAWLLRA